MQISSHHVSAYHIEKTNGGKKHENFYRSFVKYVLKNLRRDGIFDMEN